MTRVLTVLAVAVLTAGACSRTTPDETAQAPAEDHSQHAMVPVTAGWTVTDGVETPESMYYDAETGVIFASQVVGQPGDRDGNGRIAKLHGDGTMIQADWVAGLNAPKGLRAANGTLWVSDLDEVLGIDTATGAITTRVKPEGAQFLNDVAIGPDGTVYVSDMMASRIYAIKDGAATVFVDGDAVEWPNGLLVEGNTLVVGGWGKPAADFSTTVPGHLYKLDLTTKQKTLITPAPFGNIDGLESDGTGGYLLTDYLKGQLIRVDAQGRSTVLRTFAPGSADIGFVAASSIVLVPHMNENTLASYDLTADLQ